MTGKGTRINISVNSFFLTWYSFFLFFALTAGSITRLNGQSVFGLYEDNDIFSFEGQDGAYSNGTQLEYFYLKNKKHAETKSIYNHLFLKTGDSSISTYGWNLMQIMITPVDISRPLPGKDDYQYSGTLMLSHSLNSTNREKNVNLQTEWVLGVMGPYSFAGETQTLIHKVLKNQAPNGWESQRPNTLLVNLNIRGEKLLFKPFRGSEIILTSEVNLGTMLDAIRVQGLIRFGIMEPYFNGFIDRIFSSNPKTKFQFYISARPGVMLIFHNTLLEGSMFQRRINPANGEPVAEGAVPHHLVFSSDYNAVISYGRFSVSYSFKISSSVLKNLPGKDVGNITAYFKLTRDRT